MMIGVQLKATSTIDTNDVNLIMEQGSSDFKFMSRTGDWGTHAVVRKTFNPLRYFGVPTVTDDIYRGNTSTNPSEQAYYHCTAMSTDTSSDSPEIIVLVTIDYVVLLTEPKPLSQS
jgi:hypothetical protein